ncbi:MAG: BamA/TamA family outer membrane protein [bacterium]|nr:BamA/TamA family outer membrane protein [bacterium]
MRKLSLWLLFYLALVTPVDVLAQQQAIVSHVSISGVDAADYHSVVTVSGLRLGDSYSEEQVNAAVEKIKRFYRRKAYYRAEVFILKPHQMGRGLVEVRLKVRMGKPLLVSSVAVVGDLPEELEDAIGNELGRLPGRPATRALLQRVRQGVEGVLYDGGYYQSVVRALPFEENSSGVEAVFRIRGQKRVDIEFSGNELFSGEQLKQQILSRDAGRFGAVFDVEFLRQQLEEVYRSQGYMDVRVRLRDDETQESRRLVKLHISEGGQFETADIEIRGLYSLEEQEILDALILPESGFWAWVMSRRPYYSRSQMTEYASRLQVYYRDQGYPQALVTGEIEIDRDAEIVVPYIQINEGEAVILNELRADCPPLESYIRDVLPSKGVCLHCPVRRTVLREIRKEMQQDLGDLGYPVSSVKSRILDDGVLELSCHTGAKTVVGEVFYRGMSLVAEEDIAAAAQIESGQAWRPQDLRAAERRIFRLGFFRRVSLRPFDGTLDGTKEDLLIEVVERETGTVKAAVSVDSEDGLHLNLETNQKNFAGSGNGVRFAADGFVRSGNKFFDAARLRGLYSIPTAFGGNGEMFLEAYTRYAIKFENHFSSDRVGGKLNYRLPVAERLSAESGLDFYNENLSDVDPSVILGGFDTGGVFYSSLFFNLKLDQRNDAFHTQRGWMTEAGANIFSRYTGSEADFLALHAEQSKWWSLGSSISLALKLGVQSLLPTGEEQLIPLGQRLFLGGRSSLRGFSRASVSSLSRTGEALGGDFALYTRSELEFPLVDNFSWSIFTDLGHVYLFHKGDSADAVVQESFLSDIAVSPGVGLHYLTPIGPLSLEVAQGLRKGQGTADFRILVGIGSSI